MTYLTQETDPIVSIPRNLMMTTVTAQDSVLGPAIAEDKILQAMPSISLALHLLCEQRTPDSFWKPYIDILPADYNTPLYFTPEEMKSLKGSPAYRDSVNHYRNIARQYAYLFRFLHNSSVAAKLPIKGGFNYDDYRWAVSTVMTRQNQIPTPDGNRASFALIPLWDMCNHCNGTITTDYSMEQDCCDCFALREFKKDEQVFIFYGARSNAELLVHNGFVFPENELDRTAIKLGISKSDPLFSEKSQLLSKMSLEASRNYYLHKGRIPLDPQILAFLRVFCMTKEDFEKVTTDNPDADTLMNWLGDLDRPVSSQNEDKIWSFLETRTSLLLKAYETSAEEDETMLKSNSMSEPQRMIINLRLCEKNMLKSATEYAKRRKSELSLENLKIDQ